MNKANQEIVDPRKEDFKKRIWNVFVNTSHNPKEVPPRTDDLPILNYINKEEVDYLLEVLWQDIQFKLNKALEAKDEQCRQEKIELPRPYAFGIVQVDGEDFEQDDKDNVYLVFKKRGYGKGKKNGDKA